MSPTSAGITDHYASTDIAARLLAALRAAQGPDAPITPDALAPLGVEIRSLPLRPSRLRELIGAAATRP